jgi:toxin ParE1/3/4
MAKIILRQEAVEDLNSIWDYTYRKWSEEQADKYYAMIKFACKGLAENSYSGTEYFGIQRNLLGLKSGKHIIFYHVISENEIEIIRILHEAMNLKIRLTEG